MLKEISPKIKIFKMSTGEEIIVTVVEENKDEFIVNNPLQLAPINNQLQFAPYLFMADSTKSVSINKNLVVVVAIPSNDIENVYSSALSGIALPKKSGIITG